MLSSVLGVKSIQLSVHTSGTGQNDRRIGQILLGEEVRRGGEKRQSLIDYAPPLLPCVFSWFWQGGFFKIVLNESFILIKLQFIYYGNLIWMRNV